MIHHSYNSGGVTIAAAHALDYTTVGAVFDVKLLVLAARVVTAHESGYTSGIYAPDIARIITCGN